MANTVNPVLLELAPGFYLRPDGIFATKKPEDAITALLPVALAEPPRSTEGLAQREAALRCALGRRGRPECGAGPPRNERPAFPVVPTSSSLIGSLARIIGYVQAAVKLVEMLGLLGPNPTEQALKRITPLGVLLRLLKVPDWS